MPSKKGVFKSLAGMKEWVGRGWPFLPFSFGLIFVVVVSVCITGKNIYVGF